MAGLRIRIEDLTGENFDDLPGICRGCLYWENPERFNEYKHKLYWKNLETEHRHDVEEKRGWFIRVSEEFGPCGKIVYDGEKPIGFSQYGPASALPNTRHYKSGPPGKVEERVIFLSCLYMWDEEHRGRGIGTALLKHILTELRGRGFKAVETFALIGSPHNPSGPLRLYRKLGFYVKRGAKNFPLVRLDL